MKVDRLPYWDEPDPDCIYLGSYCHRDFLGQEKFYDLYYNFDWDSQIIFSMLKLILCENCDSKELELINIKTLGKSSITTKCTNCKINVKHAYITHFSYGYKKSENEDQFKLHLCIYLCDHCHLI